MLTTNVVINDINIKDNDIKIDTVADPILYIVSM